MTLLFWIIIFSLIGGLLSIVLASIFLLFNDNIRNAILPHLLSFAIGTLLGAALLGLIPHALESDFSIDPHRVGLTLLIGMLTFFLLEKLVVWRHCHHHNCDGHLPKAPIQRPPHKKQAAGTLILVGDTIHNFVDGVLIAAAFMIDIHLGIVTALAVAAHEIPQELGDFAILLRSGFSHSRALWYNALSSLSTPIGALLAYFILTDMQQFLPYALVIAASSFIYIAVADLIPDLHTKIRPSETLQQIALIAAGVFFIYLTHSVLH